MSSDSRFRIVCRCVDSFVRKIQAGSWLNFANSVRRENRVLSFEDLEMRRVLAGTGVEPGLGLPSAPMETGTAVQMDGISRLVLEVNGQQVQLGSKSALLDLVDGDMNGMIDLADLAGLLAVFGVVC